MRIAYVCADPGVPVFGRKGCSVHVQEVVRAMRRLGAQVEVFATRSGGPPPPDLLDVRYTALPVPAGTGGPREASALATNPGVQAVLARRAPFDVIYERYSLWSTAGMAEARRLGHPGILEVNSPLIEEQAEHRGLVHRAVAESVARCAFRDATSIVCVSEAVGGWVRERAPSDGRVHVLPNGVGVERFRAAAAPACPAPGPDTFTVGFVGTLKPWHGLGLLADAFALLRSRVPQARLLVVGDGPERRALAVRLDVLGVLRDTVFAGSVDPADVPAWLASMDVGVATYERADACYFSPLKVVEYMAAGLPVVATRVGQVPELVEHGRTGLLCAPGDAHALGEALGRLAGAPAMRREIGARGRTHVFEHRTWDAIVARALQTAGAGPGAARAA